MPDNDIDYLEVIFGNEVDLKEAQKHLPFAAITSTPSGLLHPDNWDSENVAETLNPLNIKFTISPIGFKWDEHGDDEQWDGPTLG